MLAPAGRAVHADGTRHVLAPAGRYVAEKTDNIDNAMVNGLEAVQNYEGFQLQKTNLGKM